MCKLKIISIFNDFSNTKVEKLLDINQWNCSIDKKEIFNNNCENILNVQINETNKTLSIELKKDVLISHNSFTFIFLDLILKISDPINIICFNYEIKNKYIIDYESLEWKNLNE